MNLSLKILHLEDIQSDAELVERTLKKSGITFEKVLVDTREEYTKALIEFQPDIILSDHSLPTFNSLEALKVMKETGIDIPFILITSTVSEEFAVSVMKEGASDYVLKDRLQRLPSAIVNAMEKFQSGIDRQTYLDKIIASEALFKKAELIAEFGTWRVDFNTNGISWSAGTFPLLGYLPGEVEPTFENFIRNIHPDDMLMVESVFKNTIDHVASPEVDFRIINKDGGIKYVHSQFEIGLNEKGSPIHIIGFNQDVTRSKLAQFEIEKNIEELKSASDRQSAILNALPPNIVLLNEKGKIIAVNQSWRKFTLANNLGVPKHGIDYSYIAISEKALGVDEGSVTKIAKGVKDVIAGVSDEFSMEYASCFQHKKAWFQLVVAPLMDRTNKGVVVLHIDITARKLAEESMLQSQANLQTIFKNTDIAYVLCNAEHKIVSFNSKANELSLEQFGRKLKIGTHVFNYFKESKMPNIKKAIQKVANNEMVSYETRYDLKDGSAKWYEARWVGIANEKEVNTGFMLAFKDITERKVNDIERDRITADLVQRNIDLEQFTYIISHNLRAPVANIIGLSNMLNNFDINEAHEVRSALSTSIGVLDGIIMDLNDILHVRGQMNDKAEAVSLPLLVEDIILSLDNLIKAENVTLTFDFNAADKVFTVKSYMHNIFYNLIINGIKYRRPDTDPVLSVTSTKKGDKMEILFTDNGKGIAEKDLTNLFGLYKRFDTAVTGKGMGLFMVKMEVENLGGKITAHSKPGEGTTFKLEFEGEQYFVK